MFMYNFYLTVNNVIIWYKEQTVYSHGQYTINHRVETLKNNSILLKSVQPDDAGVYYCEVLPENIRLQIVLDVNKAISITCDGRNVLDRTIVFRQGESHICECKTRVSEKHHLKWFHDVSTEIFHIYVHIYACVLDHYLGASFK